MKKKLTTVESAISLIIESSQKHTLASNEGDSKTANKNFDIVQNAVKYIREQNEIGKLKELLTYNDISVRVMVASYLLKNFEQDTINTLEVIASQSIPIQSFEAQMVLQEWRKGKLNL